MIAVLQLLLSEFRASYRPRGEAELRLVREQLSLARAAARPAFFIVPVATLLIAAPNLVWLPFARVAIWPALVIVLSVACGLSYEALLKRTDQAPRSTRRLAAAFTWLSFVQTVGWCSMGLFLWAPHQPMNNLLIGLALTSTLSGWTALATYHFATGTTSLPVFLAILSLGSIASGNFFVLALIAIYWLTMVALFMNNYFTRKRMILLEHERSDLVEDLKRTRDVSEAARERAETASRAKSAFLANMSHELRTPLNAILGFSEIISTKALGTAASDQYAEYGGYIHGSGQHLLTLISDILDLAKIDAGKLVLHETTVDLTHLIEEAAAPMGPRARSGGVTMEFAVAPDFPFLLADERALRQIIANLLLNAVKFTPPSGRVTTFARRENDGTLVFGVSDTGIGIAPEDQLRVFESFGQGRPDAVTADKGAGLGLPIVKGLVAAHGGRVTLASTPERGTTVTIALPAERARGPRPSAGGATGQAAAAVRVL